MFILICFQYSTVPFLAFFCGVLNLITHKRPFLHGFQVSATSPPHHVEWGSILSLEGRDFKIEKKTAKFAICTAILVQFDVGAGYDFRHGYENLNFLAHGFGARESFFQLTNNERAEKNAFGKDVRLTLGTSLISSSPLGT